MMHIIKEIDPIKVIRGSKYDSLQNVIMKKLNDKSLSNWYIVRRTLSRITHDMFCGLRQKKNWIIWRQNNKMDEEGKVEIFEPFSSFQTSFCKIGEKKRSNTPGVNFINVFSRAFFVQTSLLAAFLITFWLWRQNFVQKTRA